MNQKRTGLGRGLEALLGQAAVRAVPSALQPALAAAPEESRASETLMRIPLDLLQKGRYQPRLDMRAEALEDLAQSIRAQGVIQPIVVRPLGPPVAGQPARYEIIAGERRWRAAQLAGITDIPALVRVVPDDAAIAMALIENIQREDLNPLEEARALERLVSEFGITHQQAAHAVGRSRAAVSNLLRLLELPPEVCRLVEARELEMGHARALLALPTRQQQIELGTQVARKGLSVRETEAWVRRIQPSGRIAERPEVSAGAPGSDPNVRRLEDELAEKLGTKVAIQHSPSGRGKLVVTYNSLDELDGILAHIH